MAAEHSGSRASGKSESFFQQAALHTNAHTYVQNVDGQQFTYAVPKSGLDVCPTCKEGTLHPIGQTHDDVHLMCRGKSCGQKVSRPKNNRMAHFLEGR